MLTRDFATRFAEEWIAAWNAHDLPRVLSHYDDDFEMASPRIADVAGEPSGVLRGKERVGAYWARALTLMPDLRFELLATFVGSRSLALHYRNQAGRLAVECFDVGPAHRSRRTRRGPLLLRRPGRCPPFFSRPGRASGGAPRSWPR